MICSSRPGKTPSSKDSVLAPELRRPKPRDFNRSPMIVFYEVTQACGLACKHCRACAQTQAHPSELNTTQSRQLIDQLTEFPVPPMLVLTGGDPLCRDDIFELIEYATNAGLEVSITPSATPLVTEDAIRQFAAACIHRMAISIDGSTAATHDAVRGVEGSFDRSLQILRRARQLGIATQINTTLTPDNVDQLDDMANLFAGLDITLWSVFFLVPVGRAEAAGRLNAEQQEQVFASLWRHSQTQPYMVKTTEAPHYRRFAIQHQHSKSAGTASKSESERPKPFMPMGVNDGKGIMFVSHTGTIHPSGFMPIICGMFPQQHVVQVYQESTIFRGLRNSDQLEGKCGACEFRNICGGSRARAYAVTGNPYAEEPDCSYLPSGS